MSEAEPPEAVQAVVRQLVVLAKTRSMPRFLGRVMDRAQFMAMKDAAVDDCYNHGLVADVWACFIGAMAMRFYVMKFWWDLSGTICEASGSDLAAGHEFLRNVCFAGFLHFSEWVVVHLPFGFAPFLRIMNPGSHLGSMRMAATELMVISSLSLTHVRLFPALVIETVFFCL
jgi:hypothetical protein